MSAEKLLALPEDEALEKIKEIYGVGGDAEAYHFLEVVRGNIVPNPPPQDEKEACPSQSRKESQGTLRRSTSTCPGDMTRRDMARGCADRTTPRQRSSKNFWEWCRGYVGRGREIKGQMLALLALSLLFMLVAVFSLMRDEEEYGGEMRTKSLVYDADPNGKIGLYWMDNEANMRKATSEELKRCEELYPDEEIPICQMTYYEKVENEQ